MASFDHLDDPQERKDNATRKLAVRLALLGGRDGILSRSQWSVYCDDPRPVFRGTSRKHDRNPVETLIYTPCRKCPKCLQFRQMRWRERAQSELLLVPRSWFVTLTFSPVHLAGVIAEASRLGGGRLKVEKCAYGHVQRYFKRLRKRGLGFRYLAIAEYGEKQGRLHYHVLLHQQGVKPILKSALEAEWRSHVHARLVSNSAGSASYITKYLTKSLETKPRASTSYGGARLKI